MKNSSLVVILFFVSGFVFSQQEKLIQGKIIIKDATPQGIIILNLVNEKETVSDKNGDFSILAKPDDLLVFYATNLDKQRKIIEQEDYNSGRITMEMTSKVEQLDEVEIIHSRINAVSLGIISKPAKKYTPAERRLYASESSPLDNLLNLLSGRKKMLKENVLTEQKEFLLQKLDGLYEDQFYIETLHIEKEYIKAFQYYIVENQKLAAALNGNNRFLTTLIIIDLARQYKDLYSYEKH